MYTRCPECETVFRLSASALKKAGGRVRCGACNSTFNALQSLAEDFANPDSARQFAEQAIDDGHITKEQGEALLSSLDKLEIPDVELEDTGVEWRVLTPPADLADAVEDDLGADTSGIIVSSDGPGEIGEDEDDEEDLDEDDDLEEDDEDLDEDDLDEDFDEEDDEDEEDLEDLDEEDLDEDEDDDEDLDEEDDEDEDEGLDDLDEEDLDDLDEDDDEDLDDLDDEDFDEDEDDLDEDENDLDDLDEEDLDEEDDLDDLDEDDDEDLDEDDLDEEEDDEDFDEEDDEEEEDDLDDLDDDEDELNDDDDIDEEDDLDELDEDDDEEDLDDLDEDEDEDDEDFEEEDADLDEDDEDFDEDEDEDEDLDDLDDEDLDEDDDLEEDEDDLDDSDEDLDDLDEDVDDLDEREEDPELVEENEDEEGDLDEGELDEDDETPGVSAGSHSEDGEPGSETTDDEPRYDDNSPLPEGAEELIPEPARKIEVKDQEPPMDVHEPLAENDLDLGSPEEWEDLLEEVEDSIAAEGPAQDVESVADHDVVAEEPVDEQKPDSRWTVEDSPAVESIVMEGDTLSVDQDEASVAELEQLAAQLGAGAAARKQRTIGARVLPFIAILMLLTLSGQVVHSQRETLATLPYFPQTLGIIYRFFGYEVVPRWDVRQWQFEDTGGNTVTEDQVLRINSTLSNQATRAMPYPVIQVALTDLEDRVIETKQFGPRQYLGQAQNLRVGVGAGQQFDASLEVPALSEEAAGFKLNICYPAANQQLRCATGDFLQ